MFCVCVCVCVVCVCGWVGEVNEILINNGRSELPKQLTCKCKVNDPWQLITHREWNDESSFVKGILVLWHSFTQHHLHITWIT